MLALLVFGSPDRGARSSLSTSPVGGQPVGTDAMQSRSTSSWSTDAIDADGVERRVDGGEGLALTFDDGPDPRWTPAVLDLLRRHRARVTFCVVGEHVAAHPELVRRIADEGHALCDHTWTHDQALTSRPTAVLRTELRRTYDAIVAATGGRKPLYFRAPAGHWSPRVVAEARRLGLRPLGWSVDPADWRGPPPAAIASRVMQGAAPGAIVLLHDGYGDRAATVTALEAILRALTERRLSLVTP
jgi:peptidoglycan-N-acetylglucosamine deacetylase